MHHFFDRFLHRIFFDFASILAANLQPCWPFFAQNTATLFKGRELFVGSVFFSVFGASWPPLGAIWARFWKVLGSILEGFGLYFGSFWRQFGHTTPLGKPALSIHSAGVWFWMGWWGYAKRKEFPFQHLLPTFPPNLPIFHSNLSFQPHFRTSLPNFPTNPQFQTFIPTFNPNFPFQIPLRTLRAKLSFSLSFNLTFNLPFNLTF